MPDSDRRQDVRHARSGGKLSARGGHIEVHNEPGIGTTCKLYLPVIDATVATTRPKGPRPHAEDLGADTILVVDDADGIRRMITTILRQWGSGLRQ